MNLIPSETTRRWSQNFGALFSCTAHMTIQERLSDLYYRTLGLYYRVPSRASLWVFVPPALDVYCVFFSSESSRAPHIGLPGPGPADTSRRVKGYAHVSRKTYAQRHRAWMIDVSILRIQLHTHDTLPLVHLDSTGGVTRCSGLELLRKVKASGLPRPRAVSRGHVASWKAHVTL